MSAGLDRDVAINTAANPELRKSAVVRVFGKLVRGAREVTKAIEGARVAAERAERYYAMNDAELARVGLTRERIPEELVRVISR